MPLHKGTSKQVVSENIREMVASGHPQRQAVAAALHTKDQSARRGSKRRVHARNPRGGLANSLKEQK